MSRPDAPHKVPKRARGLDAHIPASCPSGKHPYTSRHIAVQAARASEGRYGQPRWVYRCTDCRQYHQTSQRPYRRHA